jgi:hypothetical protein
MRRTRGKKVGIKDLQKLKKMMIEVSNNEQETMMMMT